MIKYLLFFLPLACFGDMYEIQNQVKREIRVISDIDDYWQTPSETVNRGAGDCEDIAALIAHRLENAGARDVRILKGYLKNRGNHMLVRYNGKFIEHWGVYKYYPEFRVDEAYTLIEYKVEAIKRQVQR